MQRKTLFELNIFIFGLVALFHLFRLLGQWPAVVNGWIVPLWLSGVGLVVGAGLAWANWKAK